ncbi:MAG: hypothetical protein KDK62_03590 [Chlamydiia bacterium]|nr:hypothetical protein [Chlamydiia bacterium]
MISLFSVASPAIKEGGARYVFQGGKSDKNIPAQAYELAMLVLTLSRESCLAFKQRRFSAFDALLMSQGCQITACQVYSAVQTPKLYEEAEVLELKLSPALEALACLKGQRIDFNGLKEKSDLNILTTPLMCQMIRFYLLRKTRDIKPIAGVPRHVTDIKLLNCGLTNAAKESLIRNLQKEEALQAADFILERAKVLTDLSRREMLISALATRVINRSDITQVSIFYSLEAALRDFSGIVKVIDLNRGGSSVFRFPDSTPLTERPDDSLPLLVVEGYFDNGDLTPFADSVAQKRVLAFILTAAAQEVRRDPAIGECTEDMKTLLSLPDSPNFPFQLKHFYIASVKEAL